MGANKLKINEKVSVITPGIQKVSIDTTKISIKKLNHQDSAIFIKILESVTFGNYKAIRGKSKSSRYKQSKTNFKNVIWKVREYLLSYLQTYLMSTPDLKSY